LFARKDIELHGSGGRTGRARPASPPAPLPIALFGRSPKAAAGARRTTPRKGVLRLSLSTRPLVARLADRAPREQRPASRPLQFASWLRTVYPTGISTDPSHSACAGREAGWPKPPSTQANPRLKQANSASEHPEWEHLRVARWAQLPKPREPSSTPGCCSCWLPSRDGGLGAQACAHTPFKVPWRTRKCPLGLLVK